MSEPVTIHGGGLAGTTLAWALHHRGTAVRLIDFFAPSSASRIAAGLMTPITGKRLNASHRWHDFHPTAIRFYRRVEAELGVPVYQNLPIHRVFTSESEAAKLDLSNELAAALPGVPEAIRAPYGGFAMPTAGRLDVPGYIRTSHEQFKRCGIISDTRVSSDGLHVYCEGHTGTPHPAFAAVPMRPAKGEILTVRLVGLGAECAFNRGGYWLVPTDRPALFHFGATYSWEELDNLPTESARRELEAQLQLLLRVAYTVVDHRAAVRPIATQQKPRLGLHPCDPRLGYFNGLSSKGALLAPYYAEMFARFLTTGEPIDTDVDVANALA